MAWTVLSDEGVVIAQYYWNMRQSGGAAWLP